MNIPWLGFFFPGLLFMTLGTIGTALWGLGPLTVGSMVVGFLLLLAAVLQARADQKKP